MTLVWKDWKWSKKQDETVKKTYIYYHFTALAGSKLAEQLQDEGLCHVPGQIPHIPSFKKMGRRMTALIIILNVLPEKSRKCIQPPWCIPVLCGKVRERLALFLFWFFFFDKYYYVCIGFWTINGFTCQIIKICSVFVSGLEHSTTVSLQNS